MASPDELRQVLTMIERNQISAEEGVRLLSALQAGADLEVKEFSPPPSLKLDTEREHLGSNRSVQSDFPEVKARPEDSTHSTDGSGLPGNQERASSSAEMPDLAKWRSYWLVPFGIGFATIVLAASLMYQAIENSGYGFWFYCSWLPFLLGVAVLMLGWHSRTARWLHLRIEQAKDEWPRRIAFSFPLPLRIAGTIIRIMGHRIPKLKQAGLEGKQLDELILGIEKYATPETPFFIEVKEEGEDQVFIYIG